MGPNFEIFWTLSKFDTSEKMIWKISQKNQDGHKGDKNQIVPELVDSTSGT